MKNKFNLTREQNVFIVKRNIVDYIWKIANLEGIEISYPQTQVLYDGGIINGLTVNETITINNLKYGWIYILDNIHIKYDIRTLCKLHRLTTEKLVSNPGIIRKTIKEQLEPLSEDIIKEELNRLIHQNEKSKTEIAIEVMLWIMHNQIFDDGNKRVAILFANKIMIDNGCGIISISNENQPLFIEKLHKYYKNNNMSDIKKWIYDNCIDGIDLNEK